MTPGAEHVGFKTNGGFNHIKKAGTINLNDHHENSDMVIAANLNMQLLLSCPTGLTGPSLWAMLASESLMRLLSSESTPQMYCMVYVLDMHYMSFGGFDHMLICNYPLLIEHASLVNTLYLSYPMTML